MFKEHKMLPMFKEHKPEHKMLPMFKEHKPEHKMLPMFKEHKPEHKTLPVEHSWLKARWDLPASDKVALK
jgi:hypothetical protein